MALDLKQWTFLTKFLGVTIPADKAPDSVKDAKGMTDAATSFDASKATKETAKAAAAKKPAAKKPATAKAKKPAAKKPAAKKTAAKA